MSRFALPALLLGLLVLPWPAGAVRPDEMLADPALEAEARSISREIRCVVCQNQSIDDSDADLAHDLRVLVRERLQAGDDEAAVKRYLVARYGDFVLLRPPMRPGTYLLWFGPALVLALAGFAIVRFLRRRKATLVAPAPLTAEERARLAAVLDDGPERP